MGWSALETRIDELRIEAGRNPAVAIQSITREIAYAGSLRPRDRVRLLCLRANARINLGRFHEGEEDLREARQVQRSGAIAAVQIQVIAAELKLTAALATGKGWAETEDFAHVAVLSGRELSNAVTGKTDWAIRQARTRAALLTAALVTRGTVWIYGCGEKDKALRDATEAIRSAPKWAREHNARRNRPLLSAYQLVCVCAMLGSTNTQDLLIAREMAIGFRIPEEDMILRAQRNVTVLCIDVKLGKVDPEQAEYGLRNDMANLRRLGAKPVYDHILHILVWLVRECQKRTERAEWIQENLAWSGYPELLLEG